MQSHGCILVQLHEAGFSFALQRFIHLPLHIAGVSTIGCGRYIQDGLKENGEVLKMLLSTLTNIILGQKSEVTVQIREHRQVGLMDVGFSGAHLPTGG